MAEFSKSLDLAAVGETTVGLLVCTICHEILIDPIFSCTEWHPVCGFCYEKMQKQYCYCSRMLQIDRLATKLLKAVFPAVTCRYNAAGCLEKSTTGSMITHLKKCLYRPVKCPLMDAGELCTKNVCEIKELFAHLQDCHNIPIANGGMRQIGNETNISHNFEFTYGSLNGSDFRLLVRFFAGQNFVIVAELIEDVIVWWLCVDDLATTALKYTYNTSIDVTENISENVGLLELPVYGIRYLTKYRLNSVGGSFSAYSVNCLFRKTLGNMELKETDKINIQINVTLQNK